MGGINALNYYFSIILQDNLGMTQLMGKDEPYIFLETEADYCLVARVLTGVNATSYCISTALAFWIIERAGRRFLMLSGLYLQCFAYIMVAVAVGLLASAPQQVSTHESSAEDVSILIISQWGAVAITFLFFYYAAFGCTWGMVRTCDQ